MENKVFEIVTNKVIEQLNKGVAPWQMPWVGGIGGAVSYTTQKPYSLLNQMLIGEEGEFITFNQAHKLGGHVKAGAKGHLVVFAKMATYTKKNEETGEDEEHEYAVWKNYHVFNIKDCEGIEPKRVEVVADSSLKPFEAAEKVINAYVEREKANGLVFEVRDSNDAYYAPKRDLVVVPKLSQYAEVAEYYSTTFHELTHSTGHEKRLNRKGVHDVAAFGSEVYSKEELIAEMGAAFLCNMVGLDSEKAFKNSVAYLKHWADKLSKDKQLIVWAASAAQKAVGYINGENF